MPSSPLFVLILHLHRLLVILIIVVVGVIGQVLEANVNYLKGAMRQYK